MSGAVPEPIKALVRAPVRAGRAVLWRLRCDLQDARDAAAGRRDPLTPPRRMWELVTGRESDFRATGDVIAALLLEKGLQPDHAVLDVGCGIGRAAVALTKVLSDKASYDGFDIMPAAIAWCSRTITPRFPNFRFQVADVQSDRYRPRGKTAASAYVFPFEDARFDMVFLGSVFTHMFPADMRNYLREIARVLKPGGRCVISWYLLDDARRAAIAKGGGAMSFAVAGDGYRAEHAHLPEAAIAFERAEIERLYHELGLEIVELMLGPWAEHPVQGQDIVVARKRA